MIINKFLSFPVWIRAAVSLLIMMVLLWRFLRKPILWILSLVPILTRKVFRCIYLLVETPVAMFHSRFGAGFHKIDNGMAQAGEKADMFMERWYARWHSPGEYRLGMNLFVYGMCVVLIAIPSFVHTDIAVLGLAERLYIGGETFVMELAGGRERYDSMEASAAEPQEQLENERVEDIPCEITLVVSGVSSSLLVRDVPSMEDCAVLERLVNGDMVIWRGEMRFSEAEDEHVEPWVKVVTKAGTEGWSRLFYLHPENYADVEFLVGCTEIGKKD